MYKLGSIANIITSLCFAAVCAVGSAAQSQPDSQAGAQLGEQSALAGKQAQGANTQKTTETSPNELTTFVSGTLINAELTSSLDSKRVKPGDAVNARTATDLKSTDGRTILPRGTKIIGHVTQASARSAGQPDSFLGLVFDKAILKNGQEIPLNAGVQAVGAPPSNSFETNQAPGREPVGASPGAPGYGGQGTTRGAGGLNSAH
jgi:type IV secretory pathway VirB10-like protein